MRNQSRLKRMAKAIGRQKYQKFLKAMQSLLWHNHLTKSQALQSQLCVGALTVTAPSATITGNSTDGYPVTGTAPANATVQVLNSDGQIVGSGTADAEGNYSITLEPTAVAPAESLTVVAVLTAGGKEYRSNATPIVVPLDQEEQQTATPTIDPVKAGDTTISGTAEPGSTVTVTIGENEPITTETDEEGNWTVEVPEVAEGDTVTVVAQSPEKILVHQSQ